MDMSALKSGLLAALQALEKPVETAIEAAVTAANPIAGAVVTEAVNVAETVFRKSPSGVAAASTAAAAALPPPAPVPTVDVSKSPLATVPTDLPSVIAFVVALADKVDALQAATGLQGSAAMADHG